MIVLVTLSPKEPQMPSLRLGTAARTALANALGDQIDAGAGAGTIQLRNGTMPATPATAATGTLLATVTLQDPSTSAASNGQETILDPAAVNGAAAGDVTWARFLDSNGVAVFDCDVSTVAAGTGTLQMSTVTVSAGLSVDFGAITLTVPQGT